MIMIDLKKDLNKINNIIPKGSNIYFFDYPVYGNVGDMLIWKGTEMFFKESKIRVRKRYSYHIVTNKLQKGEKIEIPKDTIIVCQGGGNFGDLYSVHQNLRRLIVKNYPNHRIVILPQSIFYKEQNNMEKDFEIFGKHKDLHLYVRDINSQNIASKYIKNVYLCQDMAHSLYPISSRRKRDLSTLYFLRKDIENKDRHFNKTEAESSSEFDWELLYNKVDNKLLGIFIRIHNSYKLNKYISTNFISRIWYIYTCYMIKKAEILFNKYETIVTSRLHGHILACLMNKNNRIIDNSYGKNSSYYKCWTNGVGNANFEDE